jgi:hypothetical protein
MSSQNNSRSSKPFCKVCFDAGKLENVYTSHNVKTYNVKTALMVVTCPTLNATECRYCFKLGHTTKFCPVLEQNKKLQMSDQRRRQPSRPKEEEKPQEKKPVGMFALLEENDEPEIVVNIEVQAEHFPSLLGNRKIENKPASVFSYANMASQPAVLKPKVVAVVKKQEVVEKSVSWVDESDDEYYEDDDSFPEIEIKKEIQPCWRTVVDDDDDW